MAAFCLYGVQASCACSSSRPGVIRFGGRVSNVAYGAKLSRVKVSSGLVSLDRAAAVDRFRRSRARTRALFALLDDAAFDEQPPGWPAQDVIQRDVVGRFGLAADGAIEEAILHADLDSANAAHPHLAEALRSVLEREEMHQETLACLWHELPYALKRKPEHYVTAPPRLKEPRTRARETVRIPAGEVTLGTAEHEGFSWDNERPAHTVAVAAFDIDTCKVTNAEYLAFMDATGASAPHLWRPSGGHAEGESALGRWSWRGMFETVPLPPDWPVYVTWSEADAYAHWCGRRLPSEAEFHRAAFGMPGGGERRYPWGDTLHGRAPGNFDFGRWDPTPVEARPDAVSAFGVQELVGNGWEWTSTILGPFDGFVPMPSCPEYSAGLCDGVHYVLKGASPVTARSLVRRGFRGGERPGAASLYTAFRTVASQSDLKVRI